MSLHSYPDPLTQQSDSTKYQRNIAKIRAAWANEPDKGDAEVERYLRSEGGVPVEEPSEKPVGFAAGMLGDLTRGPFTPTPGLAGFAKDAASLAHGAASGATFGLSNKLLGEKVGTPNLEAYDVGRNAGALAVPVTGALKLGGMAGKAAFNTPVGQVVKEVGAHFLPGTMGRVARWRTANKILRMLGVGESRFGPGKSTKDVLSKALTGAQAKTPSTATADITRLFEKQPKWSSPEFIAAETKRVGDEAFARGMSKINPPAAKPQTVTEMFNVAGEAGRRGSEGAAAMSRGIDAASNQPQSFAEAFKTFAGREPFGAGKLPKLGARVKPPAAAEIVPEAAPQQPPVDWISRISAQRAQQGKPGIGAGIGVAGMQQPLSNDVSAAKQSALMAQKMGVPAESLEAQLSQQFDQATVKFVLAALPNRLPQ